MSARALVLLLAVLFCASSSPAATVFVYNTNDAFAGSLRQAMQDAPPDSTIVFQIPTTDPRYDSLTGRYIVTLTSAALATNKNLTIDGGTQKIWIQRSFAAATPNFSIFEFRNGGTITLANLTIYNGNATGTLTNGGGGINAFSTNLTVKNCLFYANEGGGYGGAIFNGGSGNLLIRNCSFAANHAFQNGALDNDGTLTIDNSTFSGNDSNNGGVGGIRSTGSATVRNTIIVGNTGNNGTVAADYRGAFTSAGYNLVGTQSAGGSGFNATGDQAGATAAAVNLGAVQDNGGPTWTMRPRPGSLAIDQGNRGVDANAQPINIDQRGYPRPVDLAATANAFGGDGSDIGAVETAPAQTGLTFTVTNTTSHNDGSCTTDDCTLREALVLANTNTNANVIDFGPTVRGTILDYGLSITNPVTINGPGARLLTLTAFGFGRIFNVASANVFISGLTLSSGSVVDGNGGAISNTGSLTVQDCAISASSATGNDPVGLGGGIFNAGSASLTLTRCTVSGCYAGAYGGGVYNDGLLNATNCTFYANSALRGGGVISRAVGGAAIMTLRNCTVTGNTATDNVNMAGFGGGGVYAEGGPQQHFVGNCLIALNTSTNDPDVRGNYTSQGHNLIGKPGDSAGLTNGTNGDIVGTNATGINPQFGSSGKNGGPTDTWSLLAASPARNAGDDALAPPTDQRGYPRIGVSDIGAFEFGSGLLRITSLARNGSDLSLGFVEAVAGSSYRLERTFELAPASWEQVPSAVDYTASQTGPVDNVLYPGAATLPVNQSKVFFRLRLLP